MDKNKLEALRARYTGGGVFDLEDPSLLRAAAAIERPGGKRAAPYAGMPTFLDLPAADGASGIDVALIGVPMDLGVSNRPGARFGPRAVRSIERIGPYHPTFKAVPMAGARAADVGGVPFRSRFSLDQCLEDIEQYYTGLYTQGVRPYRWAAITRSLIPSLKHWGGTRR